MLSSGRRGFAEVRALAALNFGLVAVRRELTAKACTATDSRFDLVCFICR